MTIFTGRTVEEAIERGLYRLGLKRENVHIHVKQKEKRGFLGFGKKRALVDIEEIKEETIRKADRLAERGIDAVDLGVPKAQSAMEATLELSQIVKAVRAAEKEQKGELTAEEREVIIEEVKADLAQSKEAVAEVEIPEKVRQKAKDLPLGLTDEESDFADKISTYLTNITSEMGIAITVNVVKESSLIVFNLNSNQDALLIGKHGKILQSLQTLAKAYANSILSTRVNIAVNVGDYHEKRKAYITSLAHRAAERARAGETVYINDLQSNERKIVHTIISKEDGVSSHSDGSEYNRYITVTKEI
ncbi:MAG TPA: RNA-binding protein [Lactococcus sp.]|uniref:RNA-binding cell elongation regulator Jag/EloR n=1 Tax=Lactococcus TaxID=1357 RepID=UPI000E8D8ACE|nr:MULTISPECIES: RNA-binding cell elongation regulator Jag/EloR [Lactococcus]MBL3716824.1 KH domain-containing protein [Lactococcus garvieae]HAP16027.1 RNA-binding protein [Lactococcus sp.]HBC90350.1 RNA-binding protein [Lactococcus sp.]